MEDALLQLRIEEYPYEVILGAEKYCDTDKKIDAKERENLLLVIRQTREYLNTDYFTKLYMDGKRVKSPQEVADWVTENTLVPETFLKNKSNVEARLN